MILYALSVICFLGAWLLGGRIERCETGEGGWPAMPHGLVSGPLVMPTMPALCLALVGAMPMLLHAPAGTLTPASGWIPRSMHLMVDPRWGIPAMAALAALDIQRKLVPVMPGCVIMLAGLFLMPQHAFYAGGWFAGVELLRWLLPALIGDGDALLFAIAGAWLGRLVPPAFALGGLIVLSGCIFGGLPALSSWKAPSSRGGLFRGLRRLTDRSFWAFTAFRPVPMAAVLLAGWLFVFFLPPDFLAIWPLSPNRAIWP